MRETVFGDYFTGDGILKTERVYRYQLYRDLRSPLFDDPAVGERTLCFVMLNPSTADEFQNDPTLVRCVSYASRWGYQHLYVVNLFAYRETDPDSLLRKYNASFDIVGPANDRYILNRARESDRVVFAWGALDTRLAWRAYAVCKRLREALPDSYFWALGLTKDGHPRHPLYMRRDAQLLPYSHPWLLPHNTPEATQ